MAILNKPKCNFCNKRSASGGVNVKGEMKPICDGCLTLKLRKDGLI